MRKGMFGSVATVLMGTGAALAQNQYYLPAEGRLPAGPNSGAPALLSADPTPAPTSTPVAPPTLTGGSTGLVPGLDCLPASVPEHTRFYGDVAYMLTWVKNGPNPGPLAIASPAGAAIYGPGTTVLIGGQDTTFDGQSGVRVNVGAWLGCNGKFGVEAGGFDVQQASNGAAITSNGSAINPTLSRPFINANLNPAGMGALVIGAPGIPGAISERETTHLWGYEANAVLNWRDECKRRVDLLAGFTYTDLRETLGITSESTTPNAVLIPANPVIPANPIGVNRPAGVNGPDPTTILDDAVGTRNQFYGAQVGARTTWTFGALTLTATGKIAAGVNHETIDRFGTTIVAVPGATPVYTQNAFLTQSSNAGHIATDKFAVSLPSQFLLGYQVTDHLNAFLGYDLVYLTNAVRPGDQIDIAVQTNANGTQVRPSGTIHQSEFWANSLLAGLTFKY